MISYVFDIKRKCQSFHLNEPSDPALNNQYDKFVRSDSFSFPVT